MSLFDKLRHESVKESEHESRDMSTIYIGIGHDNDLVISEFADIKIIMNTCTKGGDHSLDLGISIDSVYSCLLYVEDLTSKWKNSLCSTASSCLS